MQPHAYGSFFVPLLRRVSHLVTIRDNIVSVAFSPDQDFGAVVSFFLFSRSLDRTVDIRGADS